MILPGGGGGLSVGGGGGGGGWGWGGGGLFVLGGGGGGGGVGLQEGNDDLFRPIFPREGGSATSRSPAGGGADYDGPQAHYSVTGSRNPMPAEKDLFQHFFAGGEATLKEEAPCKNVRKKGRRNPRRSITMTRDAGITTEQAKKTCLCFLQGSRGGRGRSSSPVKAISPGFFLHGQGRQVT